MPRRRGSTPASTNRIAIWYWKGGVGKSTTTMMLSILAASRGQPVFTIDLDPECGTSRDFLGRGVRSAALNLKTYLESPALEPPPVIPSGIDYLDLLPGSPDSGRFFRHFPEGSLKLREGLDLLLTYQWVFMDVPHQLDNIAQLGLIAADYVVFPLELTEDCLERLPTVFGLIEESRVLNPNLTVLGGLPLALAPRSPRRLSVSAKEEAIYREYETALQAYDVRMFRTIMYLSAKHSVEEARINADFRLMHWTAQRRYRQLFAELVAAIKKAHLPSPKHHATRRSARTHRAPKAAAAA